MAVQLNPVSNSPAAMPILRQEFPATEVVVDVAFPTVVVVPAIDMSVSVCV